MSYIVQVSGDGSVTFSDQPARYFSPQGIVYDHNNNYLWVADTNNHDIRRVGPDGMLIVIHHHSSSFITIIQYQLV